MVVEVRTRKTYIKGSNNIRHLLLRSSNCSSRAASLPQDVGQKLLGWLSSDGFRKIVKNPKDFGDHLLFIAKSFSADKMEAGRKAIASYAESYSHSLPSLETVEKNFDQLEKFMKFLLQALGPSDGAGTDTENCVIWLLQLRGLGSSHPLLSLQDLIKQIPAWKAITDECVRTAKTTKGLRPLKDRVMDTLKQGNLTARRLHDVLDNVKKCRGGMRAKAGFFKIERGCRDCCSIFRYIVLM